MEALRTLLMDAHGRAAFPWDVPTSMTIQCRKGERGSRIQIAKDIKETVLAFLLAKALSFALNMVW